MPVSALDGTRSAWCERNSVAYQGVPVATIKRHATGKGNAPKDVVMVAITALEEGIRWRGWEMGDISI
jgi:hypothetical protein